MTTERYVDTQELAELMGVSERTVKRWVAEGAPSETWGMRARRFLLSEVVAWRRAAVVVSASQSNPPGRRANVVLGPNLQEVP